MFYTYIYLDPRKPGNYVYGDYTFDYEPFYIGKGSNGQCLTHLKEAKSNILLEKCGNKYKTSKIRNILKETLEPIILKVEENLTEQEAFDLEIWFIWAIGRSDLKLGSLTNYTDGGEGGANPSLETREKISKANRGNLYRKGIVGQVAWNKGVPHTKEVKEKMSASQKGRITTEETRLKISRSNSGVEKTEDHKMKLSKIRIGKKHSEDTILKLQNINAGSGNAMYGKKHSQETIQKIKEARKKQAPMTEEGKRKISQAHKGKIISDETREKMKLAAKRRKK